MEAPDVLSAIMSAHAGKALAASNARIAADNYRHFAQHRLNEPIEMPKLTPEPILKAMTTPPIRERVIERDTGMGWGAVIVAFVLGGMLS